MLTPIKNPFGADVSHSPVFSDMERFGELSDLKKQDEFRSRTSAKTVQSARTSHGETPVLAPQTMAGDGAGTNGRKCPPKSRDLRRLAAIRCH